MALRSLAEGRSQKMRRWNLRSTASSRSCGRLVAPSTTILSADGPRPLHASLARVRACSQCQQMSGRRSLCLHAAPSRMIRRSVGKTIRGKLKDTPPIFRTAAAPDAVPLCHEFILHLSQVVGLALCPASGQHGIHLQTGISRSGAAAMCQAASGHQGSSAVMIYSHRHAGNATRQGE